MRSSRSTSWDHRCNRDGKVALMINKSWPLLNPRPWNRRRISERWTPGQQSKGLRGSWLQTQKKYVESYRKPGRAVSCAVRMGGNERLLHFLRIQILLSDTAWLRRYQTICLDMKCLRGALLSEARLYIRLRGSQPMKWYLHSCWFPPKLERSLMSCCLNGIDSTCKKGVIAASKLDIAIFTKFSLRSLRGWK
jgi:hypothetical protein